MILLRNILAILAVAVISGLFGLLTCFAIDEAFKAPYPTVYNTVGREGLE